MQSDLDLDSGHKMTSMVWIVEWVCGYGQAWYILEYEGACGLQPRDIYNLLHKSVLDI